MRYLRTYESTNLPTYDELLYKYVTTFHSEKEFIEWCLDKNEKYTESDVDWYNVMGYDLPLELDLPSYNKEITEILCDVATVDLDDPAYADLRSGKISIDEWIESIKYNL